MSLRRRQSERDINAGRTKQFTQPVPKEDIPNLANQLAAEQSNPKNRPHAGSHRVAEGPYPSTPQNTLPTSWVASAKFVKGRAVLDFLVLNVLIWDGILLLLGNRE